MVILEVAYRHIFKKRIINYCSTNDIEIIYHSRIGNGRYSDFFNLSGDITNIDKLDKYVNILEAERERKGFWYKLLN